MNTRTCDVCGEIKPINQFGNGITIPKTTCLECAQRARDRDKPKPENQEKKVDPIMEYLEELK